MLHSCLHQAAALNLMYVVCFLVQKYNSGLVIVFKSSLEREMYFKELVHVIVEADRSEVCRLKTQARVDVAGLNLKVVKAEFLLCGEGAESRQGL